MKPLSHRTLYAFFAIKMFVWCAVVFGLGMDFAKLNPMFEIRTIPWVQLLMVANGAISIYNYFRERYWVTLSTTITTLVIWNYAALGYAINNIHDPTWVRVLIELLFVFIMLHQIIRNHGLSNKQV